MQVKLFVIIGATEFNYHIIGCGKGIAPVTRELMPSQANLLNFCDYHPITRYFQG